MLCRHTQTPVIKPDRWDLQAVGVKQPRETGLCALCGKGEGSAGARSAGLSAVGERVWDPAWDSYVGEEPAVTAKPSDPSAPHLLRRYCTDNSDLGAVPP
jgi:hypothetical protein